MLQQLRTVVSVLSNGVPEQPNGPSLEALDAMMQSTPGEMQHNLGNFSFIVARHHNLKRLSSPVLPQNQLYLYLQTPCYYICPLRCHHFWCFLVLKPRTAKCLATHRQCLIVVEYLNMGCICAITSLNTGRHVGCLQKIFCKSNNLFIRLNLGYKNNASSCRGMISNLSCNAMAPLSFNIASGESSVVYADSVLCNFACHMNTAYQRR